MIPLNEALEIAKKVELAPNQDHDVYTFMELKGATDQEVHDALKRLHHEVIYLRAVTPDHGEMSFVNLDD